MKKKYITNDIVEITNNLKDGCNNLFLGIFFLFELLFVCACTYFSGFTIFFYSANKVSTAIFSILTKPVMVILMVFIIVEFVIGIRKINKFKKNISEPIEITYNSQKFLNYFKKIYIKGKKTYIIYLLLSCSSTFPLFWMKGNRNSIYFSETGCYLCFSIILFLAITFLLRKLTLTRLYKKIKYKVVPSDDDEDFYDKSKHKKRVILKIVCY